MTTPEGAPMRMTIDEMLRKAAAHQMTPAERREQRISFVYGQMIDCAPEITREQVAKTVDEYDASLAAGVTKLLQNLRAASANLFREDLLHDSGLMREAADLIESLSASYSAACGERDKHRKHAAVSDGDVLTLSERLEAAESQLSLALVERDRAREALAKYATYEDFDYQGDTPVSYGFHCHMCDAAPADKPEQLEHQADCILSALSPAPNATEAE